MKVVKSSFSAKELTSRNLLENGEADSDAPGRSTVGEEEISSTSHELFTDSDVVKREAESMSRRSLSSNTAYEYKDIYLIELISGALDGFKMLSQSCPRGLLKKTHSEAQVRSIYLHTTHRPRY
ncbi:endoplasmin isoform X2 [Salvia divinorum]|uniref:Endoplasmin isoform X2 n=1 Tax=Salvia divinorum TaxID=28513 RepID=A0ABD1I467_SALDI